MGVKASQKFLDSVECDVDIWTYGIIRDIYGFWASYFKFFCREGDFGAKNRVELLVQDLSLVFGFGEKFAGVFKGRGVLTCLLGFHKGIKFFVCLGVFLLVSLVCYQLEDFLCIAINIVEFVLGLGV